MQLCKPLTVKNRSLDEAKRNPGTSAFLATLALDYTVVSSRLPLLITGHLGCGR
jgi:hypothetical protein